MQPRPFEISALAPFDDAAAAAIHAATFPDAWTRADVASLLGLPTTIGLRAGSPAGHLEGFVLAQVVADEAEVLTIAVDPASQRRGIGRKLLAAIAAAVAARGARALLLEVAADNAPALALYRAEGFVVTGQRLGYYERAGQPSANAILMRKTLDQT